MLPVVLGCREMQQAAGDWREGGEQGTARFHRVERAREDDELQTMGRPRPMAQSPVQFRRLSPWRRA